MKITYIQKRVFSILDRGANWNTLELKLRLSKLFLELSEKEFEELKASQKAAGEKRDEKNSNVQFPSFDGLYK